MDFGFEEECLDGSCLDGSRFEGGLMESWREGSRFEEVLFSCLEEDSRFERSRLTDSCLEFSCLEELFSCFDTFILASLSCLDGKLQAPSGSIPVCLLVNPSFSSETIFVNSFFNRDFSSSFPSLFGRDASPLLSTFSSFSALCILDDDLLLSRCTLDVKPLLDTNSLSRTPSPENKTSAPLSTPLANSLAVRLITSRFAISSSASLCNSLRDTGGKSSSSLSRKCKEPWGSR